MSWLAFLAGYVVCVLFPLPYINRAILDMWARVLSSVHGSETAPTGPTGPITGPTAPAETGPTAPGPTVPPWTTSG